MASRAHIDFETGSAADLRKTGVYPYATHPSTRVWVMSWRVGDEDPIKRWRPGDKDPTALLQHVAAGGVVVAHNAAFERTIWNWHLRVRVVPHWPELRIAQQDCTMARAAVLGIPSGLDDAGHILGANTTKSREGKAVMMKCAKPRTRKPCLVCDGTGRAVAPWDEHQCSECGGVGEVYTWWI